MGQLSVLLQVLALLAAATSVTSFQPQIQRRHQTLHRRFKISAVGLKKISHKILVPVGLVDASKLFDEQRLQLPRNDDSTETSEYLRALKEAGNIDLIYFVLLLVLLSYVHIYLYVQMSRLLITFGLLYTTRSKISKRAKR